jgi:hypothetical protein
VLSMAINGNQRQSTVINGSVPMKMFMMRERNQRQSISMQFESAYR